MGDKKDIQDFLHLYLGCKVEVELYEKKYYGIFEGQSYNQYFIKVDGDKAAGIYLKSRVAPKPLLRRLSDMTEEEWKKCFELSRGVVDQSYPNKMTQLSGSEIMFVLGKGQFVFGFHSCPENDVRIGDGICFYSKSYLIKESLSVEGGALKAEETWYNDMKEEPVQNVNHIFLYLLKQKFDLFQLIENQLAIETKTPKP